MYVVIMNDQIFYETMLRLPVEGVEVVFDERNPNFYKGEASHNSFFLKTFEVAFNDQLRGRGHVFLNEVLDALGFERTAFGAIAGWHHSSPQNFVHFDVNLVDPGNSRSLALNIRFVGVEPIITKLLK